MVQEFNLVKVIILDGSGVQSSHCIVLDSSDMLCRIIPNLVKVIILDGSGDNLVMVITLDGSGVKSSHGNYIRWFMELNLVIVIILDE